MSNHSATINGLVNANGSDTTVIFEYGLDTNYGTTVDSTPVTGTTDTPVSAEVTGLNAVTEYHFRVSATNVAGTSVGEDMVFTTLADAGVAPTVSTQPATNIS